MTTRTVAMVLFITFVVSTRSAGLDTTLVDGAHGEDVVNSVVNRISRSVAHVMCDMSTTSAICNFEMRETFCKQEQYVLRMLHSTIFFDR